VARGNVLGTLSDWAAWQPPGVSQPAQMTPAGSVTKRRAPGSDLQVTASRKVAASLATTTAPPPRTDVAKSRKWRPPIRAGHEKARPPFVWSPWAATSRARLTLEGRSAASVDGVSVGSAASSEGVPSGATRVIAR
jgi:hypothetical protein